MKRLRATRGAQVWARRKVSRRDLVRFGRAPGVAVVCLTRCRIRGSSGLATGVRAVRGSRRRKTALVAGAGQAHVLSLAINRAERQALRRARRSRARFRVSVSATGVRTSALEPSLPVGR
ncbi:MAG: hypothetical protein QOJ22_967 [Thermoleophilaceae bacterium]|nr:hypothetical protein [Thermoleophilaceae bacterium]